MVDQVGMLLEQVPNREKSTELINSALMCMHRLYFKREQRNQPKHNRSITNMCLFDLQQTTVNDSTKI
jgi:hypothetical protein